MSRETYKDFKFNHATGQLVAAMNLVIDDLSAQGYRLTVRQLYYQLVSKDIIENTERSYKRVTGVANDARLAGMMDWDAIEDRTREFQRRPHWSSGGEILAAVGQQYHMDMWETQRNRVFVIIEKEALVGIFESLCKTLDIPLLAARGYPSVSVVREFVKEDILPAQEAGQDVTVLHLGDHDPSGIDMTRDLQDRIQLFTYGVPVDVERIALNMDQIKKFKPPPNPAKVTDSRFEAYARKFGQSSWELDAMKPEFLNKLVDTWTRKYIDTDAWDERQEEIDHTRARLLKLAKGFNK